MSKIIDNYVLQHTIGQGQYGKVYKGVHMTTNRVVAIKVIKLERFKQVPKLSDFTMNEINTLQMIRCDNIIGFVEMMRTMNNIYLVYDFCNGGNLEELIHKKGFIKEEQSLVYFEQLLNAFKILTKEKILHRDLKPSNILLHDGIIKIADFGFCKTLQGAMDLTQTMVGSPIYMAPEVLLGEPYSLSADIWSLGVCLYEMLFGKCPFEDHTIPRLIMQIKTKRVEIPTHIQKISEGTEWLIRRMLELDPQKRITWNQIYEIYQQGREARVEPKPQIKLSRNASQKTLSPRSNLYSPRRNNFTPTRTRDPSKPNLSPSQNRNRSRSPVTPVRERGKSPVQPWANQKIPSDVSPQKPNVHNSNQAHNRKNSSPSQRLLSGVITPAKSVREAQNLALSTKRVASPYSSEKNTSDLSKTTSDNNKYSNGSTDLSGNMTPTRNNSEILKYNLRVLLSKRTKLLAALRSLGDILKFNETEHVQVVSVLLAKQIQQEIDQFCAEMESLDKPDNWDIMGKWSDFRGTSQFQKCQTLTIKDRQRVGQMMETFNNEMRNSQIQTRDSRTAQKLNLSEIMRQTKNQIKHVFVREITRYCEYLYVEGTMRCQTHLDNILRTMRDLMGQSSMDVSDRMQAINTLKNLYTNF